MKPYSAAFLLAISMAACAGVSASAATYFVDPAKGDDANAGTSEKTSWRSLAKVNSLKLAPGDTVVIAPGNHEETLAPAGEGTAETPVVIRFLPGIHEFAPEEALRRPWFISNSCDAPEVPKPMGILIENCQHFRLVGGGVEGAGKTLLLMGGRMMEAVNSHSVDVTYEHLVFDLKRPTVSEYRVLEAGPDKAVVQIAEGSSYEIKDGKFAWTGDWGQGPGQGFWHQQVDLATGRCWRSGPEGSVIHKVPARDLGDRKVELSFADGKNPLVAGRQYHFRFARRDSAGVHNARSKDIVFRDCDFYALTNMGFVSQFTENLTFQRVRVAPLAGTLRTCSAWADIFQFSNCKGTVRVEDCVESGMQDDAINCHGTHLRIIGKPSENQLKLRYMQPQTYGFAPYVAGDEIAVISHSTLRELPDNPRRKVKDCVQSDTQGKDWTVTLDGSAPAFGENDVVDNITWHPDLIARNNWIGVDPVRGFLITTRGKVLVEGNTFHRCHMAGILIEDDAEGWFESTCVRNMTLRNNTFIGCGVEINPASHSRRADEPVHENIRIEGNRFEEGGRISAHHVKNLVIRGNTTPEGKPVKTQIDMQTCSDVKVE
jgi:hypothetical protein